MNAREDLLARQQRWSSRSHTAAVILAVATIAALIAGTLLTGSMVWPMLLGALAAGTFGHRTRT